MKKPIFRGAGVAIITPYTEDGVNFPELGRIIEDQIEKGTDAVVITGTTGESATMTDEEHRATIKFAVDQVKGRIPVIAGTGSNETAYAVELSQYAEKVGADAVLVVTPYYSKPPADALLEHFVMVADATDLPVMLYDIPGRSGVPIATDTLIRLGAHPRIVAVKDAKNDISGSAQVLAATDLDYFAGDDAKVLPLLAIGGVGVIGTSTVFTGRRTAELIDAWLAGNPDEALRIYRELLPVYTGVFATQGCMLVKAGLAARGFGPAVVRQPLLPASDQQAAAFVALLDAAGL